MEEKTGTMEELVGLQKKALIHARIRTVLLVLFAVPALALLFIGTRTARENARLTAELRAELSEGFETLDTIRTDVHRAAEQSAQLNSAASKLLAASDPEELKEVVASLKDALAGVSEAAKNAAALDPEAVNGLLRKLDGELDGLSGALDKVSRLDPEAINNLLTRLDDVMNLLDKLSNALDKISSFRLFG